MARALADGDHTFSHFGADANLFEELEDLFRVYGETGSGRVPEVPARRARRLRRTARSQARSRPGRTSRPAPDLLFYEGLHGAVATEKVDVAQYADLLIGVVPVINLEGRRSCTETCPSAATPRRQSPRPSCDGCTTT